MYWLALLIHSKAAKVTISPTQNKKWIILSISDNGVGFDTTKKRVEICLENIKSRAASCSAIPDFISQTGRAVFINNISCYKRDFKK